MEDMLMALATCHTVIWDVKKGQYTSASPDDLALVSAAKQFGFEFKGKNSEEILTIGIKGSGERYFRELNVCEFTSTRKRQSNIL